MNHVRHTHNHAWLTGIVVLIIAVSVFAAIRHRSAIESHHSSATGQDNVYFHTLPPDARLPSGAECARWVRASSSPESRPANALSNRNVGYRVHPSVFPPGDSPQVTKLAPSISGEFTGTTQEILQWASCKWGIDQNVVFAQAAAESWWKQSKLGDWTSDAELCPPGHGIGAEGRPGVCPQSYGILQVRYSLEKSAWPGIDVSTAMNVDVAYAVWRSCYDGYETWLNNSLGGRQYHAGDLWGCVGRWFAGNWYTPEAEAYIDLVKKYMSERVWLRSYFARTS